MDPSSLFFNPSSCNGNMFLLNGDSIFRASRTINIEETSKRQLYFSSPDDLFVEEYYDDQSPGKKRRLRAEQVHLLETSFETENKLEPERKTQLAKKLGLQPRQVAVWFQNRRARWKTKQLERDYDLLKSSFDVLTHSYNSTLNDNQNLKAEVKLLSEKLQAKEVKMLEQKPDHELILADIATNADNQSDLQLCMLKVEDRLRTGTDESVVADGLQMVDNSGDSYFVNNDHYTSPVLDDHVHSEEDGTGDEGGCYFSHVPDPETQHQQQQEGRGSYLVGVFGRDI